MSLFTSLYSGTSGLLANSEELSTVGDNIANANTIGFKSSRVSFSDQLSQSLLGGGQVGLGSRVQLVQKIITQGALTSTGLATDLAIQGDGLFVVRGQHNGQTGTYYTRAGQFTVDGSGALVNLEGLRVQGYAADSAGVVGTTLGDLDVGKATSQPSATANISLKANLQADAAIPAAWSPANPAGTSNFSTGLTVYDSLGTAHQVDVYFRRTGAGAWEWHALADGGGLTGGTAGTATQIASGTLAFNATGALTSATQASTFNPLNATNPQPLAFDFSAMTQFSAASAVSFASQDGHASGDLAKISIDAMGNVSGAFTNGTSRVLGQVALARFSAPDRVERLGGTLLGATQGSGQATVGAAGAGGRGTLVAGALEQSNVDLAEEFVRMIAAQRGFQANSKTISTADQLLQELMTIKR
ncbi:MAG TPA: flagellar hook protein FlgE [Myxococcales bacterium]|nr:flagellar hook protein FlgE [Myxococcales bacterium]